MTKMLKKMSTSYFLLNKHFKTEMRSKMKKRKFNGMCVKENPRLSYE